MNNTLARLTLLLVLLIASSADARNIEPGSVWISAQLGLDSKMGGRVGGSDTLFTLGGEVEYALESQLGLYGRATLGLADTQALKLQVGTRWRFTGLELPLSPYVSGHIQTGHLMGVMGANLWTLGAGFGGGLDYFLTRKLTAGLDLAFDFGGTLGSGSAGYNTMTVLFNARYGF